MSNGSISVRETRFDELPVLSAFESSAQVSANILATSLAEHEAAFRAPGITYLTIVCDGRIAGHFVLADDPEPGSVEFRRIVIAERGRGIGQVAIARMEDYCRETLGKSRIWLDVFAHNPRGMHVYEKLGYRRCGESELLGKPLYYYNKRLTPD